MTINRHNVNDLEETAKFLLEDIGLPAFSTNSASHMGLCRSNAEQVQLTVDERSIAMESLMKLTKKYNGRIKAAAGPLANAKKWMKMEKSCKEGAETRSNQKSFLRGCGETSSKLAICADGTIVPCNQRSHIELGRINKDDLQDVWQNHPELIRLRARRKPRSAVLNFAKGANT